eukprot:TRINITY_DN65324_c0_g1_i1.p1 TRINITY_DN65324_c0_g1~~TRINITY_DN65324_c0_g1_i1.p1  ORF type:complete len:303 (+),score=74.80 TRINITY_DN65324_c0_g1_i1:32-910(+)
MEVDAAFWKSEGNSKLKANDWQGAVDCYTKGIEMATAEMQTWFGTAEQAMESNPKKKLLSQLLSNRAHVYMLLERFYDASEDCAQAVGFDNQNCKAYWRGTTAALRDGRMQIAAEMLRMGLSSAWEADGGPALAELLGKHVLDWERGANKGIAAAQYNLGLAYLKGNGVKTNVNQGLSWLNRAARQQDEMARLLIEKVEADRVAAIEKKAADERAASAKFTPEQIGLWTQLANGGNVDAQFNLGLAYLHGEGVLEDRAKCEQLWRMAAAQGDQKAQDNLAHFFSQTGLEDFK